MNLVQSSLYAAVIGIPSFAQSAAPETKVDFDANTLPIVFDASF